MFDVPSSKEYPAKFASRSPRLQTFSCFIELTDLFLILSLRLKMVLDER